MCRKYKVEPLPKATTTGFLEYRLKRAHVLRNASMVLDIALDSEQDDTLFLVSSDNMMGINHAIDREFAMMCNLVEKNH